MYIIILSSQPSASSFNTQTFSHKTSSSELVQLYYCSWKTAAQSLPQTVWHAFSLLFALVWHVPKGAVGQDVPLTGVCDQWFQVYEGHQTSGRRPLYICRCRFVCVSDQNINLQKKSHILWKSSFLETRMTSYMKTQTNKAKAKLGSQNCYVCNHQITRQHYSLYSYKNIIMPSGFMNTAVLKRRSPRKAKYLSVNLIPFPRPLIRPLRWDKCL